MRIVERLAKAVLAFQAAYLRERALRMRYQAEAEPAAVILKPSTRPTLRAIRQQTPRPQMDEGVQAASATIGAGPMQWLANLVKGQSQIVDAEEAMAHLLEFLDRLEASALQNPAAARYLHAACGMAWQTVCGMLTERDDPDLTSWRAMVLLFGNQDETDERLLWWLWDRAHEESRDVRVREAMKVG